MRQTRQENRFIIAMTIIIAIIIAIALYGYLTGGWEAQSQSNEVFRNEANFLRLDREALDEAYKKHVMRLFEVWVTDYKPGAAEPPRAAKGARNARLAYEQVVNAIEKREQMLLQRQ